MSSDFHDVMGGRSMTCLRWALKSVRRTGMAPSDARWAVSCWQSIIFTPLVFRKKTRWARATLDASVIRANMDSPKNIFPIQIPYAPPARVFSYQSSGGMGDTHIVQFLIIVNDFLCNPCAGSLFPGSRTFPDDLRKIRVEFQLPRATGVNAFVNLFQFLFQAVGVSRTVP